MKLFCSAQHRNIQDTFTMKPKIERAAPKGKPKAKPSKTIGAGAVDD